MPEIRDMLNVWRERGGLRPLDESEPLGGKEKKKSAEKPIPERTTQELLDLWEKRGNVNKKEELTDPKKQEAIGLEKKIREAKLLELQDMQRAGEHNPVTGEEE